MTFSADRYGHVIVYVLSSIFAAVTEHQVFACTIFNTFYIVAAVENCWCSCCSFLNLMTFPVDVVFHMNEWKAWIMWVFYTETWRCMNYTVVWNVQQNTVYVEICNTDSCVWTNHSNTGFKYKVLQNSVQFVPTK